MQTMNKLTRSGVALLLAASLNSALTAAPASEAELQSLREQVHQLQQQLAALSQRIEAKETAAAAAPAPAPAAAPTAVVTAGEKGFQIASADNAFSIRFRAVARSTPASSSANGGAVANDSFLLRRARIITEGNLGRGFSFVFVPEFGGSSVSILDAAVGVSLDDSLQLKFGKLHPPLASNACRASAGPTSTSPRSPPTSCPRATSVSRLSGTSPPAPSRTAGVFGGVADNGTSPNSDFDNDKDLIARVYATPSRTPRARPCEASPWAWPAASAAPRPPPAAPPPTAPTASRCIFKYADATVADGLQLAPDSAVRLPRRALRLAGEYVVSSTELRSGTATATLANRAWQVSAPAMCSHGEFSSFSGVKPRNSFNLADGTWGAFELVGRVSPLPRRRRRIPALRLRRQQRQRSDRLRRGLQLVPEPQLKFSTDFYVTDFASPTPLRPPPPRRSCARTSRR
jgi:phosphate-selective porin OprO/OprP